MTLNEEELANTTLKIECGISSGSGFHFKKKDTIITNTHIIMEHINNPNTEIYADLESYKRIPLDLVAWSSESEFDFAILKTRTEIAGERVSLYPKSYLPSRGTPITFSGFPHGIDHLLVQKGYVSGPYGDIGFYIDASINGGNSGGPVVDEEMKVIGYVTERRFLDNMKKINHSFTNLHHTFQQISGQSNTMIAGISFSEVAKMLDDLSKATREALIFNASTGIGMAYKIDFVDQKYRSLYS